MFALVCFLHSQCHGALCGNTEGMVNALSDEATQPCTDIPSVIAISSKPRGQLDAVVQLSDAGLKADVSKGFFDHDHLADFSKEQQDLIETNNDHQASWQKIVGTTLAHRHLWLKIVAEQRRFGV